MKKKFWVMILGLLLLGSVMACGNSGEENQKNPMEDNIDGNTENPAEEPAAGTEAARPGTALVTGEIHDSGLQYETGIDANIDFAALQAENPDIFGWLYLPDTEIDFPILQSEEADDYYEHHDASGAESETGALYTELANMRTMCDFNTVIHGKEAQFSELYRFADPEYFEKHNYAYLYIKGNVLTYEIFAAYEREDTSLIRTYDFTYGSGCQQFLDDMYNTRIMGMNIREGWNDADDPVTPYHYLITLTTRRPENPGKQYVVIAALVNDAAGTISRLVEW